MRCVILLSGLLATFASAASLGALMPADAGADSPPYLPGATITTSGNGCPQGGGDGKYISASGSFAQMDFTLHNFTAAYGGGNSVIMRTTNCEEHISAVDAPPGWQVSASNFTAGAFVVLEPGITVTVYFTIYWSSNASDTASFSKQYQNTANGTVTSLVVFQEDAPDLWSPCAGSDGTLPTLNINFRASLTSSGLNAEGQLPVGYFGPLYLVNSESYTVTEDVGYKWQSCTS